MAIPPGDEFYPHHAGVVPSAEVGSRDSEHKPTSKKPAEAKIVESLSMVEYHIRDELHRNLAVLQVKIAGTGELSGIRNCRS